ncbi:hypothetical protein RI129_009758 [Pyrocoelia pectoralis]|uniref:Lysophospholipid acyltransferase 7 n=1 Tax=Pyrocoelia pectoralis TaxID=417401 RepID=A0AAN7ZIK9_9COLE
MDLDDIIYMVILLFCIGFGTIYREIKSTEQKKWVGSGLGVLIILIVSGYHIWHPICTFLINAAIILILPKSYSHLISFGFSFLYLLFFRTTLYFGIPYPPTHTNMIQMIMTLKLAGLGFEVNMSYLNRKKGTSEEWVGEEDLTFLDVFHYTFNYIGLSTGPYYRYRTHKDFFNQPFHNYVSCNQETMKKLVVVPMFVIMFLGATYFWPLSYAQSDEFYAYRSWLYRLWYTWPTFLIFRLRLYIGMILSECICTMAGLGAYPQLCKAKPGEGPTESFKQMNAMAKNPALCKTEQYDFETIHNVNPYEADFCTTFRNGIKNWNICVQYWFAVNVYKRFPNKRLRTVATMVLSAYWHGVYTGHYVCLGLAAFYLAIEDVYIKLFIKGNLGNSLKIWEWIIWFLKMQAFSYLSMAFVLLSLSDIHRYYASCYYIGFVGAALMYALGLKLLKNKRLKDKDIKQN